MIAPDVGGGFGSKLNVYAEEALALALARRLGRPIKWIEERTEGFHATIHGRDVIQEIELAATKEGRITGIRVRLTAAMGAYLQLVTPGIPLLGAWIYNGAYDIPAYGFECTGVFTHTTPTDAYRGAGRPEATYAIERTVDALARAVGKDPVEVRRLNFIKEFPHTIASGLHDRLGRLRPDARPCARARRVRRAAGGAGRSAARAGDAKQLGIGLSTYNEMCGLAPSRILGAIRYGAGGWDAATIRCLPTGTVQALSAPRRTARATRPRSRRSSPTGSAARPTRSRCSHGDTAVDPARDGHLRQPQPRRRRGRALPGRRQGDREGAEDRRPPDRGLGGRPRVRGRPLPGQGLRPGHVGEGGRARRVDRAQPPRRDGARARGDRGLRPAQLQLARRRAPRRRRGRLGDGRHAPAPLRGGRRRRHRDQPDDRRRAGARRDRAGRRAGALRGAPSTTTRGRC